MRVSPAPSPGLFRVGDTERRSQVQGWDLGAHSLLAACRTPHFSWGDGAQAMVTTQQQPQPHQNKGRKPPATCPVPTSQALAEPPRAWDATFVLPPDSRAEGERQWRALPRSHSFPLST